MSAGSMHSPRSLGGSDGVGIGDFGRRHGGPGASLCSDFTGKCIWELIRFRLHIRSTVFFDQSSDVSKIIIISHPALVAMVS